MSSSAARIEPDAVGLRLHRELARALYARVVRLQTRLGADALDGKPWLADARRLVQRMVDLVHEDDTALVGLTAVKALAPKGGTQFVRTHAANVAILSIRLGAQAKLGRAELAEIGLAALLHDVGLDATGDPAMHGLHGAECVLQLGPFESVVRPALLALVHHMSPQEIEAVSGGRDAVTAIVQIADAYDTLTARGGRPDLVLRFLLLEAGRRFDTTLVKLFAHALGIYPPGSTVRLTSGEVGVVLRACRDPRGLDRPLIRLLRDASGRPLPKVATLDLDAREPRTDARVVASAIDPRPLGIAPAAVFLGTI
jgi:hypothetical protein